MRKFIASALVAASLAVTGTAALASEAVHLEKQSWSWQGVFGRYDHAQLRRGFQIYKEVCSNCHSANLMAYRNLQAIGFSEDQVKAFAAEKTVQDGPNDEGNMFERPARASDPFVKPFPNEQAARVANNGALPPDLSLMAKARVGGPDYIYNLMLGFEENPPEGFALNPGMYYNKVFPGHQIGMPPQLMEDMVTYTDGTKATPQQLASDITAFLNWTAEPELEARKSLGLKAMLFLVVLTAMFYALKRKIWANAH